MISLQKMILQGMFEVREELEAHVEKAKKETREYVDIADEMDARLAALKTDALKAIETEM